MAFIPYSNENNRVQTFVTVDKQGRVCLNSTLRKKLNCEDKEIHLVLLFDPDTRSIGLTKTYPGKINPFKFDKKGYAYADNFLRDNDIEFESESTRYYYDGVKDGIYIFKANITRAGRVRTTLKQEKNGNLVKMG